MVISHKHRFIFLKTLKTAGTSIEVFLSGVCDERDVVTPIYPPVPPHAARNYQGLFNPLRGRSAREIASNCFDCVRLRKFYNHIRGYRLRDRLPPRLWDGYFKFCVERNPWDKTLSFFYMLKNSDWHAHRNPDLSLDDYLGMGRFVLNYPIYTDRDGSRIVVDRVLRYEHLDKDLDAVFRLLGIAWRGSLNVRAKAGYRAGQQSYREVFTDAQAAIVGNAYAKEIELHGYSY
jgi:hypothetical protein